MPNLTRKLGGKILGGSLRVKAKAYLQILGLVWREYRRMMALRRDKRLHQNSPEPLLASTRTKAHIVDKGLQTDGWRPGRGKEPYDQLRVLLDRLKDSPVNNDPSYLWAVDIAEEYERAQTDKPLDRTTTAPKKSPVGKDDILELIKNRRSVRSFEDRLIEPDVLRELAEVTVWSPTSCNRQPTRLFFTQNPEKVQTCLKQCAGATCLGATPCFVSVCADSRFYMMVDRNLPYIDASLGAQNMLLLAHAQGIRSTVLNWMHHTPAEDAKLRETLGIPEHYVIIFNVIMGYAARLAPPPGRKGVDQACVIVE